MRPLYTEKDAGREHPVHEAASYRSDYWRDYARLLHSPSFRRLQGKTQLFPGIESDFFRNRLTHSLEVAQIAKSIALRLTQRNDYFAKHPIDVDLVEAAALAHDLGHPPFGHNGEKALDACMRGRGGFEGNAQSLRIVARLEKKGGASQNRRAGLNLTYRTLASILKYDNCISIERNGEDPLIKGYYQTEKELVARIKRAVIGSDESNFKTVECQIMDLADDIAYSTYDLEDALKAGFVTPIKTILAALDETTFQQVKEKLNLESERIIELVMEIWLEHMVDVESLGIETSDINVKNEKHLALLTALFYRNFQKFNDDGEVRTKLTSELVNEYVEGVEVVKINEEKPALSVIELKPHLQNRVDLLKHLTYGLVIQSPRLKTVEYRGYGIVKDIFDALTGKNGEQLLPEDYRELVADLSSPLERDRAICDFIAGMTDRYAVEFYGRLHSESAQTIFKPL